MTEQPQAPARPTAQWGGAYRFPRAAFDAVGGVDSCDSGAQQRVREAARAAGHEPEGRVRLRWYDADPLLTTEDPVTGERKQAPFDPDWKWCRAVVTVRLHAARAREVGVFCPRCGGHPATRGTELYCPACD